MFFPCHHTFFTNTGITMDLNSFCTNCENAYGGGRRRNKSVTGYPYQGEITLEGNTASFDYSAYSLVEQAGQTVKPIMELTAVSSPKFARVFLCTIWDRILQAFPKFI